MKKTALILAAALALSLLSLLCSAAPSRYENESLGISFDVPEGYIAVDRENYDMQFETFFDKNGIFIEEPDFISLISEDGDLQIFIGSYATKWWDMNTMTETELFDFKADHAKRSYTDDGLAFITSKNGTKYLRNTYEFVEYLRFTTVKNGVCYFVEGRVPSYVLDVVLNSFEAKPMEKPFSEEPAEYSNEFFSLTLPGGYFLIDENNLYEKEYAAKRWNWTAEKFENYFQDYRGLEFCAYSFYSYWPTKTIYGFCLKDYYATDLSHMTKYELDRFRNHHVNFLIEKGNEVKSKEFIRDENGDLLYFRVTFHDIEEPDCLSVSYYFQRNHFLYELRCHNQENDMIDEFDLMAETFIGFASYETYNKKYADDKNQEEEYAYDDFGDDDALYPEATNQRLIAVLPVVFGFSGLIVAGIIAGVVLLIVRSSGAKYKAEMQTYYYGQPYPMVPPPPPPGQQSIPPAVHDDNKGIDA